MVWNTGENGEQAAEVTPEVTPEVTAEVTPPGNGGDTQRDVIEPEIITPEEQRQLDVLRMYRSRMHDVTDERFEQVIEDLRERKSIRSIARGLIEEGHCPHLRPATVIVYIKRINDVLGLPVFTEQTEELAPVDDEPDEIVEGQPPLKRLRWLSRVQHSRVRKALKMEGLMGGMTLPTVTTEMKFLSELIDKEMAVALKTGEMKQEPVRVEVKQTDPALEGVTPAEAFRVLLVRKKVIQLAEEAITEDNSKEGE